VTHSLPDPQATARFGEALAAALHGCARGAVLALHGELGAGKTSLARAVITALGHDGPVASPTYTLLEPYALAGRRLWHCDLYRVSDPEELEFLGLREIDPERDWLLIEWPDRGIGFLPAIDLTIELTYAGRGRRVHGRPETETGRAIADRLRDQRTKIGQSSKVGG